MTGSRCDVLRADYAKAGARDSGGIGENLASNCRSGFDPFAVIPILWHMLAKIPSIF